MSRIYKIGTITIDVESIIAIDKPTHYSYDPTKVHLHGGGIISTSRTYGSEISHVWEEYLNDKKPKPTIEELEKKIIEKNHYIAMLKADMEGMLRSVRR